MSEDEFIAWATEHRVRAEWVEGEVIVMAPSNIDHADLNGWLYMLLREYVDRKDLGRVIFDVFTKLTIPRRQLRVPDVLFVAKDRLDVIKATRIEGAPDLVIEIVSPDSQSRDWREKHADYQSAGVREYWIIDPISRTIEASAISSDGRYKRIEEIDGKIASAVVEGWFLRPEWLWQQPRPLVSLALAELGLS